jgi:outer membrane protein
MTSKFLRFFPAAAVLVAMSAMAQTGSTSTSTGSTGSSTNSLPSTPSATSAAPPASVPLATGPTKVGTINIQDAIFGSNEGRREMETLSKKYEPKQTELKAQNDELEALKKQMTDQGPKLNEDAAANLKKTIETKQKSFDRAYQDFQEEAGNAQQEAAGKILQKMAPMIVKFSQDNGFTLVVDTSKPWPQSPVLWWGEAIDITRAIVDAYNTQSGVAAPTSGAAAKPAAPRTGTGTAKPATGGTTKPQ